MNELFCIVLVWIFLVMNDVYQIVWVNRVRITEKA